MDVDHKVLAKLYTKCKILSIAKEGDSLTQIQSRTKFAYSTIVKTINELERAGIIKTREDKTSKGKVRKIIYISSLHSKSATRFLEFMDKMNTMIENPRHQYKEVKNSTLFEFINSPP